MKTTVFEKGKQKLDVIKKGTTALAVGGSMVLAGALPVLAADGDTAETAIVSGMTSAASSMPCVLG